MNRDQVIKDYCRAAELYFLKPWEIAGSDEKFKIYNISKEDFVRVIPEDIYEAMVVGCEDWKPRFELTNEEYIEILKIEEKKLKVWRSISKINNKILKESLTKYIEEFQIENWDELENKIKMIKIIDR